MRKGILIMILLSVVFACKKSKKDDLPGPNPPLPEVPAPGKALLKSPALNEPCLNGVSVSASESSVNFTWDAATNAESYEVVIKNLLTNASSTHPVTQAALQVTLTKNTPYSWYVKAKTTKTTSVSQSDTWKFYNSGSGTVSYAPFPAEIVSPGYGANVSAVANKVILKWTSSDVDNDIVSHAVYFGTSAAPAMYKESITKELDVTVTSNTTYYWKVITKDAAGNTSDSGVFQFKVD